MDPVSQVAAGALFAGALPKKVRNNALRLPLFSGGVAGAVPDLDIFIRSATDPLLSLEYHRHFTHSLAFIPIGALICAVVLWIIFPKRIKPMFQHVYIWCFAGMASHGLLDACTSYGTQLLQPFSNLRISWDLLSIIDPLITLPIVGLLGLAFLSKKHLFVSVALVWAVSYLGVAGLQHHRALDHVQAIAEARGHTPERIEAKPTFGNLLVYKGLYAFEGRYHTDGIRLGLHQVHHWQGTSLPAFQAKQLSHAPNATQRQDIERYRWFAQGWLAQHPDDPNVLIDMRYSALPESTTPLWGIRLTQMEGHVERVSFRNLRENSLNTLWKRVIGEDLSGSISQTP